MNFKGLIATHRVTPKNDTMPDGIYWLGKVGSVIPLKIEIPYYVKGKRAYRIFEGSIDFNNDVVNSGWENNAEWVGIKLKFKHYYEKL